MVVDDLADSHDGPIDCGEPFLLVKGQRSHGRPIDGASIFTGDDQFLDIAASQGKGLDARTGDQSGHVLHVIPNDFDGNMQFFAAT